MEEGSEGEIERERGGEYGRGLLNTAMRTSLILRLSYTIVYLSQAYR